MHLRRCSTCKNILEIKLKWLAATAPNKVIVPEDARSSQHPA